MAHNERARHRSPIVADVPTGRATDRNLLVVCRENRAPPTLYATDTLRQAGQVGPAYQWCVVLPPDTGNLKAVAHAKSGHH